MVLFSFISKSLFQPHPWRVTIYTKKRSLSLFQQEEKFHLKRKWPSPYYFTNTEKETKALCISIHRSTFKPAIIVVEKSNIWLKSTEHYTWNWKCTIIISVSFYNSTYLHNLWDGFCLNNCVYHSRTEQAVTVRNRDRAWIVWRTVHILPYFRVSERSNWFSEVFKL